jgi:hypothetical protein
MRGRYAAGQNLGRAVLIAGLVVVGGGCASSEPADGQPRTGSTDAHESDQVSLSRQRRGLDSSAHPRLPPRRGTRPCASPGREPQAADLPQRWRGPSDCLDGSTRRRGVDCHRQTLATRRVTHRLPRPAAQPRPEPKQPVPGHPLRTPCNTSRPSRVTADQPGRRSGPVTPSIRQTLHLAVHTGLGATTGSRRTAGALDPLRSPRSAEVVRAEVLACGEGGASDLSDEPARVGIEPGF